LTAVGVRNADVSVTDCAKGTARFEDWKEMCTARNEVERQVA
jgi:hypothetical protein